MEFATRPLTVAPTPPSSLPLSLFSDGKRKPTSFLKHQKQNFSFFFFSSSINPNQLTLFILKFLSFNLCLYLCIFFLFSFSVFLRGLSSPFCVYPSVASRLLRYTWSGSRLARGGERERARKRRRKRSKLLNSGIAMGCIPSKPNQIHRQKQLVSPETYTKMELSLRLLASRAADLRRRHRRRASESENLLSFVDSSEVCPKGFSPEIVVGEAGTTAANAPASAVLMLVFSEGEEEGEKEEVELDTWQRRIGYLERCILPVVGRLVRFSYAEIRDATRNFHRGRTCCFTFCVCLCLLCSLEGSKAIRETFAHKYSKMLFLGI